MRRILATYPSETQTFLAGESDPFHNPVGAALERGTAAILGYLLEGGDRDALAAELQQLIRIRAVQQFTSSQAIGFVFLLKDEVRERLGDEVAARGLHGEQLAFESGIDEVAMVCAELYVQAREQLFQSQLKSVHRQTHKLVERMNKMKRSPREGGGSDEEPVA
jgi:hypothetical protein